MGNLVARRDQIGSNPFEDAAEQATVTGWVCKTCRRFYGNDERTARWCCASDMPCQCGARVVKHYTKCEPCREKAETAKWEARELKPWDGDAPLYSETLDRYFFHPDDVLEAIHENGGDAEALRFLFCDPVFAHEVDEDYFNEELPEDMTLDDVNGDISEALAKLNEVIAEQRKAGNPLSWIPSKVIAIIES